MSQYTDLVAEYLDKRIDYDKVDGYQCVDWTKLVVSVIDKIIPGSWGNAINWGSHPNALLLKSRDQIFSSEAQSGDIVVLRPIDNQKIHEAGHIGTATGVNTATTVEIVAQNNSGSGTGLGNDAIKKRVVSKTRVYCLFRQKNIPPASVSAVHPYAWAVGKSVFLKPVPTWRVYRPGTKIVIGTLTPAKFGGLKYIIRAIDPGLPNRVLVKSAEFGAQGINGLVSLPIDGDAVIK